MRPREVLTTPSFSSSASRCDTLRRVVLRMTVLKDNLLMNYVTSLLLGLACAALFYTRQYNSAKKESKLYGVVCVILAIMAIIYGGMGLLGILSYLGVF